MRRSPVVLLTVLALWTTAAGNAFAQTMEKAEAEKALIDQERQINESIAKRDKDAFRSFVAADAVWARGGGFVPVSLFVDALDQFQVTNWDIGKPRVIWVDPTTAVLMYVWTGAGKFGNRELAPHIIASTVWTKRGDRWIAVHHHESDALQGQ